MTTMRQRGLGAAFLAGVAVLPFAMPAGAFEIFGIRLWGSREEAEAFEVIDPIPVEVTLTVEGPDADELEGAVRAASALWGQRESPASGRGGLLARAKGDYRRILAALYNAGYYSDEISIRLAGQEAANMTLASPLPAVVPVTVVVRPGPQFRFRVADFVNPPPPPRPGRADEKLVVAEEAFRPGEPARAGAISAASVAAVERWRQASHAKAREASRDILADHPAAKLDAVITLEPGPRARFGRVRVEGTRRVDPDFILWLANIPEGAHFDPDRVEAAQRRLAGLGVFRSVRIEEAETVAPDGALDMTILADDGPPRTLGIGATVSTNEGLGIEAFWQHNNLFGRAERLRFEASVTSLGLVGTPDLDYNVGMSFLRPGVLNPNADFIASLGARALDLDTYRETSITGKVGLQRTNARNINGELSFAISRARFEDFFGTRDFLMFTPMARGEYDRRDDALDPTRGYFLQADVRPFYESEFGNFGARGTLEGRVYRGFGAKSDFVLAARARVGSYYGPDEAESPPDQLFFAGGAGSVRGYAYRSIGVEFTEPDGDTGVVGGRSLADGSFEGRYRATRRFGGVGFVDAGYVSPDSRLGGFDDAELRAGVGLGVRYFTGLGPLRFDVATPINRRSDDSIAAFYIGIGQAF